MKIQFLSPLVAIMLTSITACSSGSSTSKGTYSGSSSSVRTPSPISAPSTPIKSEEDARFERKLSRFETYLRWSTNVSSSELIVLGKIACDNWRSSDDSYAILRVVNERVGNASVASAIILAGAEVYCPAKYAAILRSIMKTSY